jgi:hypothetical protein
MIVWCRPCRSKQKIAKMEWLQAAVKEGGGGLMGVVWDGWGCVV